jgi:HPt (histidine-containing phosphotransfer) domain-containing protein
MIKGKVKGAKNGALLNLMDVAKLDSASSRPYNTSGPLSKLTTDLFKRDNMKSTPPCSLSPEVPSVVQYEAALNRLGGDEELFKAFINIFDADAPVLMAAMSDQMQDNDAAGLVKSAHALRGLMSNFGANECCQTALQIENLAQQGDLSEVEIHFSNLKDHFGVLACELRQYL